MQKPSITKQKINKITILSIALLASVLSSTGCKPKIKNKIYTMVLAALARSNNLNRMETEIVSVDTPSFSPIAGNQTSLQNISISTTTLGATIYYTTDGSIPTTSSTIYSTAFTNVSSLAGKTIKAFAVKSGFRDSSVLSGIFSYPPLKTGAGSIGAYTLVLNEDGLLQNGISRSYTGPTQHSTFTSDYTTTDNSTGLIWKSCSEGLSGAACSSGIATPMNWATATGSGSGCDALNSTNSGNGYAGLNTWRLPIRQELETLPDYGNTNPAINTSAFPSTILDFYWSSTTYAPNTANAVLVFFPTGAMSSISKTNFGNIRCISGLPKDITFNFMDSSDGTIKDNVTGLIWQKCSQGQTNDSTCSGTVTTVTWADAITYCSGLSLAGKTWRLPQVNELKTIVDSTKAMGAGIETTFFPSTVVGNYWSSTTYQLNTSNAWVVNFGSGNVPNFVKTNGYYARCVSEP